MGLYITVPLRMNSLTISYERIFKCLFNNATIDFTSVEHIVIERSEIRCGSTRSLVCKLQMLLPNFLWSHSFHCLYMQYACKLHKE